MSLDMSFPRQKDEGRRQKQTQYYNRLGRADRLALGAAFGFGGFFGGDAHAVERSQHEDDRDQEEDRRQDDADFNLHVGLAHLQRQFDGEQAEERGELDDRVERDGGRVLERIADGVADDGRLVKLGAFFAQDGLDDFLGVVPR